MVLRTQDGLPVYDGEQIQIGGNETYISVYRKTILPLKSIRRIRKNEYLWSTTSSRRPLWKIGRIAEWSGVVSVHQTFMELSKKEASTRDTAYREYKWTTQNIVDAEEAIKESGGDADLEEIVSKN